MKDSDFKQLNIVFTEHNRVWAYCCFHKDTLRPNLSISLLDRYYGRYKCWACNRNGCLSKEQMEKLNLGDSAVYKSSRNRLDTRWQAYNKSCYDNLQKFPLLKLGLAKQLNISTKSLDDWLVGFDGSSFTIPMYREELNETYREGGVCGVQRRFSDGTKRCIIGSQLGLIYSKEHIHAYYYIFICEGFSDGISVYDLGLNSIARPHCHYTEGIPDLFEAVFESFCNIVIIPDSDAVGLAGAKKLQGILRQNGHNCTIFDFDEAKDVRQLIQLKGKDYVKQELEGYL